MTYVNDSENKWARSVMDNASDFGSEDCRFESCRARVMSFKEV